MQFSLGGMDVLRSQKREHSQGLKVNRFDVQHDTREPFLPKPHESKRCKEYRRLVMGSSFSGEQEP